LVGTVTFIDGNGDPTSPPWPSGVTAGVDYYYLITATDPFGNESLPSNLIRARAVDQPIISVPTDLGATFTNAGAKVQLHWSNPRADLSFQVQRLQTNGAVPLWQPVPVVWTGTNSAALWSPANVTSAVDSGPVAGGQYQYRLVCRAASGLTNTTNPATAS